MKKVLCFLLAVSIVAGTLSGCMAPSDSPNSQSTAQTGNSQAEEKTLTYAIPQDITSLDPRDATATVTASVITNIFSTLVTTDANQKIVMDAAESYSVVDDTTYKFTLKKGIKFQNGDELTSEDVKYTLDTIRDPKSNFKLKSDFSFMSCEIIDKYNLYIKTDKPNSSTLLRLNYIKILPKNYIEKIGNEEFAKHPIGSGPYKFVAREKDSYIEMAAYNDYFGGKPKIDKLMCKVIPEASARISALEAGEVDLISGVSSSQVASLESKGFATASNPTTRIVYFTFNTLQKGPLQNVKVRQALNYAIDRDSIIKGVMDGYATKIPSLAIDSFKGYDASIKGFDYNPEKAKQLLAEAGYANGLSLKIDGPYSTVINGSDVAQAVAAQLKEVGIATTVSEGDVNTVRDEYTSGKTADLEMYSWGGPYNDICLISQQVFGTGGRASAYSNKEFDSLVSQAAATIDEKAAQPLYTKIQQHIVDNAPGMILYQQKAIYAYNKSLKGWAPRSDEMLLLYGVSI